MAKEVAAHFFISPVYVGRVIQQASGETFKQYVNRLKMEEAKQLLSSSDQLVYEIAEELGFKDSKYFISRFTEETGMSPAEYRRKKGKLKAIFANRARYTNKNGLKSGIKADLSVLRIVKNYGIMIIPSNKLRETT